MAKSELIRGSVSPYQADLKFLCGDSSRLVQTTDALTEKFESIEAKMDANFNELRRTLTQLSNQLGIRPIEAETSRQPSPVTFSDAYVRDDPNRLPLVNRKSLLRKIDMPKFDGSNAYDWLSKVERFFSVGRYSDFDKLDLVALSLEGDVLKWFNWKMICQKFPSWDAFRRRLLWKFGAAPAKSSENVTESFEEKSSYTEQKLILQYQEMNSTTGNKADVESAHGANGANRGGDIDALLPPPPILPPNVEPLHVKTEPVEKKNLRVPMARKGFGPKGQKIPLLTNHFQVDVADLQGHFYHYSVGCAHKERLTPKSKRKMSLSFKTWRFKFKKRHKWKSKLLLHSGFDGNKLTEFDFHLSENHSQDKTNGLLVFPWNLMILQFFLFIHLEDKVCLSGASNSCSEWLQGLLETRIGLTVEIAGLLEVVCVLAACMMHEATVISAKLPETIRGIELVTDSGQLKAVLAQIIQGTDEAYTKIIDKLQIKLKQGMDLLGASWHCSTDEMTQFHSPIGLVADTLVDALHSGLGEKVHTLLAAEMHVSAPGQQKSSSIWHRWRRKD